MNQSSVELEVRLVVVCCLKLAHLQVSDLFMGLNQAKRNRKFQKWA